MATMTIEELVKQLHQVHGRGLRSVVLYGSAATGEQLAGRSDQNVLVIVEHLDVTLLRTLAATTQAWGAAGNPPPLTLTMAEWKRSADIFPLEYADILERHRVLHGESPFDGIQVHRPELRLQVEHEAMGKLLKLRAGVMAAGHDIKAQQALMSNSLSTLMVIFRGVMRLHGEIPPREYAEVARAVAKRAGFNAAAFERVIAMVRAGQKMASGDTEGVLQAYVAGMEALVQYLDSFDSDG